MRTTLCYIEQDGKYLMLHRVKKKEDLNAGKWIGVGGKFEEGENAEDCVVREVFEETGLTLTKYEKVGLVKFVSDLYEDEDMYLFKGLEFTGEVTSNCPEGELKWVPIEEVPSLPTWEGDRYFLKALVENRKDINMTVRYEGDVLVEFRDDTREVEILTSKLIKNPHGFSTRYGGVSDGIFDSLNLGMNRGDDKERVVENWRRFLRKCGIDSKYLVCGKQVHGGDVYVAGKSDLRKIHEPGVMQEVDGYVTAEENVPLGIFTADCVPILMEDFEGGIVAAVHSGWRSTVSDIAGEAIKKMTSQGAKLENICVAIGPAIDQCCFEVGPEVVEAVEGLLGEDGKLFYRENVRPHEEPLCENEATKKDPDVKKYMLDLRGVVKKRFLQLGVLPEHIEMVGGCTMCEHEKYWSHRYTKGERGSLASTIMKKK